MGKIKVFVSFDVKNDKDLKRRLDAQAKKRDSQFELAEWSVPGAITEDWKTKVRDKIKNVDQVIVICGKYTDSAKGVDVELEIAREENIPYFLLKGHKREICKKPEAAKGNDIVWDWDWKFLKELPDNAHNIINESDYHKNFLKNLVNELPDEPSYSSNEQSQGHLFAQYKLYVEMADQIDYKRQKTNSFFVSIDTALIGLLSYFSISESFQLNLFFCFIITVLGIMLNYLWFRLIRSYHILHIAKSMIIKRIENFLPLNIYNIEGKLEEKGRKLKLYIPIGRVESFIPLLVMFLYIIILLGETHKLFIPLLTN